MKVYTVSDITKYIKQAFVRDAILSSVYIKGEISNYKQHYSGHCYFTLKDSNATIRAVMFKSRAQFLRFRPHDGLQIIAGGQISVFERDGQYQLYVEQLLPDGVGDLSLAFQQLKERLSVEGLFDESRKRPLPMLPQRIGIVTSPTGAVLRDIVTVSKRRHPGISLTLFPVKVQGPEAPKEIARAITVLNRLKQVDVIIVGRGGGSIEELWAFNEEEVVRSIAASEIPIVSAVGHDTDYTLSDFAADRRAATPSQAAELVVPDAAELRRYVKALRDMLIKDMYHLIDSNRTCVLKYISSRFFTQPYELIKDKQQLVDELLQRLVQATGKTVVTKQHAFKLLTEKLLVLNPLSVLARGYSITRTAEKEVIRSVRDVVPGQELEIILVQGSLTAKVITVREGEPREKENR
ncbi:exodeoxyribonuclease VII large subunit [Propionispora hippei]|uniref:Exodeoxyribonuclease 7 large subunit n=1 Tax=Propionispora hippei DSM 15287 TaxID=1123003 RepID=A0A1M6AZY4_9FIRM|nr:Exodeoxyribonuclease VII large subunit [Propionispora hippei DSM 15287]